MGIPTTVAGACQLILAGTTRHLDAAYCNHHLMTLLGLLDITIITKQDAQQPTIKSKLQAARDLINLYGSALVKTKANLPNLYHFRTQRLRLTPASPEAIVVDGEMVDNTPLEVSSLPSALTVIAPAKRRPTSVEKVAGFWVQKIFPSVSALIAALGLGGLIGLPITFWLMKQLTSVWLPAQTEALETNILQSIQQLSSPFGDQVMLLITHSIWKSGNCVADFFHPARSAFVAARLLEISHGHRGLYRSPDDQLSARAAAGVFSPGHAAAFGDGRSLGSTVLW
jgi:hypothetical protein